MTSGEQCRALDGGSIMVPDAWSSLASFWERIHQWIIISPLGLP